MQSRRVSRLLLLAYCRLAGLAPVGAAPVGWRLPRLVFTVTSGRSGSESLCRLFACVAGVEAAHEPAPHLELLLHDIQFDDRLADLFWRRVKMPRLAAVRRPVYVETSHLVSKGYFEPMLRAGLAPSVIVLRRPAREVAMSLYRIGTVPGRSKKGRQFCLTPDDRTLTTVADWDRLDDYQVCYWYALETEARQAAYPALLAARGCRVVETGIEDLNREGAFEDLLQALEIPFDAADAARIAEIRGRAFNRKSAPGPMPPALDPATLSDREAEVRAGLETVRQPSFPDPATGAR